MFYNMDNNKISDVDAKEQFKAWLKANGYTDVEICSNSTGADVEAKKEGKRYYFEIKKTGKDGKGKQLSYFGAATLTEWKKALENEGRFFFIIAIENDKGYDFYMISPQKFLRYSTIPPYKVYFNIGLRVKNGQLKFTRPGRRKETIVPDDELIISLWESLKDIKRGDAFRKEDSEDDFELLNKK